MKNLLYRTGSTGAYFFFALIVFLFCIYLSISEGGTVMYIITGFFFIVCISLFVSMIKKVREMDKEEGNGTI